MSTDISIRTPRIYSSLHNTFRQFQAELAMSSLYFLFLYFFSVLELFLLFVSVLVHWPSDWSLTNYLVLPSIACSLKLDVVITLLPSQVVFPAVLLTTASSWGSSNILHHSTHMKFDCITDAKDVFQIWRIYTSMEAWIQIEPGFSLGGRV